MKKSILIAFLSFCLTLLLGCGSNDEVPSAFIEQYLYQENKLINNDLTSTTWVEKHQPNKDTHTDQVQIIVTAETPYVNYIENQIVTFQYDRSSDLWKVIESSKWQRKIELTSKLCGTYSGQSNKGGYYEIEITDVSDDSLTLNLDYEGKSKDTTGTIWGGGTESRTFHASCSGTYALNTNFLALFVNCPLPNRFYAYDNFDKTPYLEFWIEISSNKGISKVTIGDVYYE